jgi:acyl-CoA synthetase (AMP-forming)/AMP-acid ligase II
MISGLGVLGFGVGGIEAEAVLLGEPLFSPIPTIVGLRLTGRLPAGTTATDLVLTVTERLRAHGVVGAYVEAFGDGLATISLADRATIANMSPEFGATTTLFPIDEITLDYLRTTGRSGESITLVETYAKAQGLWRTAGAEPLYDAIVGARTAKRRIVLIMYHFYRMLMRLVHAAPEGAQWTGLKTIIYGGAPMYVSDVIKALDCFGAKLYQLFGQGESPMTITGLSKSDHLGARDALHLARLGSCGLPRTGVQVRVVDEAGRDVPIGEVGEIITCNETVMLGYWAKPLESALALRDQWLYTGDLGCLDQQGYLTLKDRSKDLIISGGSNIYPREVEEVLLLHEDVNECSVVGRAHPDWGEEVVAFVVSKSGGKIDSKELEQLCLDNIARFKRPKAYFMVDGLPKNNYGKVLKSVLRADLQKENAHE